MHFLVHISVTLHDRHLDRGAAVTPIPDLPVSVGALVAIEARAVALRPVAQAAAGALFVFPAPLERQARRDTGRPASPPSPGCSENGDSPPRAPPPGPLSVPVSLVYTIGGDDAWTAPSSTLDTTLSMQEKCTIVA